MIRSLKLKNFQAWPEVTLPLSPITVVIGETNAGKSSLLRGLACVMFNAFEGQGMVRSGATMAEVEVETQEGDVITWARGNNVNRYTVNGQLYDKPGREVPGAVQQVLGIHELEFDGEVVRLQWAPQMDAPFLLADSGAKATRMLGVAGNAAVVAQASRLAQQETKNQADALRYATTQQEQLRTKLETFADVLAAQPIADQLQAAVQELESLQDRKATLQELYDLQTALLPQRASIQQRLQTAEALVKALQDWHARSELHARLRVGAAVAKKRVAVAAALVYAERMVSAHQQYGRLHDMRSLMVSVLDVHTRTGGKRLQLQHATTNREQCRLDHDRLVSSMTCPTCGRVKEAA